MNIRWLLAVFMLFTALAHSADTTMSPQTYRALQDAQQLLQQEQYDEAIEELDDLAKRLKPSFALALVYQLRGQTVLTQDKPDANVQAIKYFQKALDLNVLSLNQQLTLAGSLGQLYLMEEQITQAINTLEPVVNKALAFNRDLAQRTPKKNEKPIKIRAQLCILLAGAHQRQEHYSATITWANRALTLTDKPKENWYQMLAGAYYQTKQYAKSAATLNTLTLIKPENESYWQQRATAFQQLNRLDQTLNVLEHGYAAGYIKRKESLLLLAQLLLQFKRPESAARVLEAGMSNGVIERKKQYLDMIANAWQQSRERSKAIDALVSLGELEQSGRPVYRAAQLAQQNGNHQQSIELLKKASTLGQLKEKERQRIPLLMGIAAYEIKDWASAKRYFQQGLDVPLITAQSKSWLEYVLQLEKVN